MESKVEKIKDKPYISVILIIINTLIFMISMKDGNRLYEMGGVGYFIIQETNELYRIITAMFLHADTSHLFSNMIMLFAIGDGLEVHIGHFKYLLFYLLAGIGGNIASIIVERVMCQNIYSIGASGAVYGLLGVLLAVALLKNCPAVQISWKRMVFVLVFMIYSGFQTTSVNNTAHIAGLFVGFVLYFIYSLLVKINKNFKKGDVYEN